MSDKAETGVSAEAVQAGFEQLSTSTRWITISLALFFLLCAGMSVGLWFLLGGYLSEGRIADAPKSSAPLLTAVIASPLEPMPAHNDLDWQDLVHLRQREDEQFRRMGCRIDPTSGEAEIPPAALDAVMRRYGEIGTALAAAPRFPPPIAPFRAGAGEPLPLANIFPPVGAAATAEQTRESIYRPPTGVSDVTALPTQSGPEAAHDNPTSQP